jgi:hypothetical protein
VLPLTAYLSKPLARSSASLFITENAGLTPGKPGTAGTRALIFSAATWGGPACAGIHKISQSHLGTVFTGSPHGDEKLNE